MHYVNWRLSRDGAHVGVAWPQQVENMLSLKRSASSLRLSVAHALRGASAGGGHPACCDLIVLFSRCNGVHFGLGACRRHVRLHRHMLTTITLATWVCFGFQVLCAGMHRNNRPRLVQPFFALWVRRIRWWVGSAKGPLQRALHRTCAKDWSGAGSLMISVLALGEVLNEVSTSVVIVQLMPNRVCSFAACIWALFPAAHGRGEARGLTDAASGSVYPPRVR